MDFVVVRGGSWESLRLEETLHRRRPRALPREDTQGIPSPLESWLLVK